MPVTTGSRALFTWAGLKFYLESRGIRDSDIIDWISISGAGHIASARVWRGVSYPAEESVPRGPTLNPFAVFDLAQKGVSDGGD